MAQLEFNPETFEYKDLTTEKIDRKTGKPCTPAQIIQTREFIPVGWSLCVDKKIYWYWHHYKLNEYTELVQIIGTCDTGISEKVVGQIQILAYKNIVARKYQFPILGFSYSQNKIDLKIFNTMLKYTQIQKYESFYEPNGLQAIIVSFDVMPDFRKKRIGQTLLYLAELQIDPSIPLYLDKLPYEPVIPFQVFKRSHNLSPFSIKKIYGMCQRLGFRVEKTIGDERLAIPPIERVVLDRKAPVNAEGVRINYSKGLKNFKYRLSKEIKQYI